MVSSKKSNAIVNVTELVARALEGKPRKAADTVWSLAEDHNRWHNSSINLVASHNLVSPTVKAILGSDLAYNIAGGWPGERDHSGNFYLDGIEMLLLELVKKLFSANYVEYRAPSGAIANGLFIFGAMKPGDTAMAIPRRCNGHHTYWDDSYAGIRGLKVSEIPCTTDDYPEINVELLASEAERLRPKWLILGTAILLFPYPMKELSAIAREVGAQIFYDGAHFLGLAAGGQFHNPILEGAIAMTGSTQKTLPGPVGGLLLMQDEQMAERVIRNTRRLISNYSNNRTAALAITMAEMWAFGKEYASAVVRNAQALAKALDAEGLTVLGKDRGFTQSHIVLVDMTNMADGVDAAHLLEEAQISSSPMTLTHVQPAKKLLRLGSNSCTRRGMGEGEMREVARLIRRVVLDSEDPQQVRRDVLRLASAFQKVNYCF